MFYLYFVSFQVERKITLKKMRNLGIMTRINISNLSFPRPECISDFVQISEANRLALTIIYATFIPLIIAANLLLIIGIMKTMRKKLTTSQFLFLILGASDLSLGMIHLPIQLFLLQTKTTITCAHLKLRGFWFGFPIALSGATILLISIDRYVHVTKNRPTKKLMRGLIIGDLLVAFAWAIAYALISDGFNIKAAAKYFISLSIYEGSVLATGVLLNVLLLGNVRMKARNSSIKRKTDSLTKTIGLITTTLVLTYIPSVIVFNVAAYTYLFSTDREKIKNISVAVTWSLVPAQLNAVLNSVIYCTRNTRIMRYFKHLIQCTELEKGPEISMKTSSILRMENYAVNCTNSVEEVHAINNNIKDKNNSL